MFTPAVVSIAVAWACLKRVDGCRFQNPMSTCQIFTGLSMGNSAAPPQAITNDALSAWQIICRTPVSADPEAIQAEFQLSGNS